MQYLTRALACLVAFACLSLALDLAGFDALQRDRIGLQVCDARAEEAFDIVIRGGRIVDGSGAPWYSADIGVSAGKIAKIGNIESACGKEVIDATGLIVAPGFIDMMGQSATPMMFDPASARNLLTQGITTINAGEGGSAAPLDEQTGARQGWTTMHEYFALLDMKGLPVNVVQTVGHTQVRRLLLGDTDRRPSDAELERMRELVREAMEAGAIGVSTALIYPPAVYATTQEITALAEVAGQYGGRYYTHMRNEGDRLLEAIEEALEIGRSAKTPVHIYHLKTAGRQNWGKMPLAIARIKAARAVGEQVTADIYPYINNGLGIAALIHPRHLAAGHARLLERIDDSELRAEIREEMEQSEGWENWFRHVGHDWNRIIVGQTDARDYREYRGQSIAAIATANQEEPWDVFFSLVKSGAFVLPQSMSEANKILALQQDFVSFCTDVGPASRESSASHPRAYGSFPRLLSHYVRDLGAISLERAVAQASAVAANDIQAFDRGRIAVGLAADVIALDYPQLKDNATFADPAAVSSGVRHVVVNGVVVLKDGEMTRALPGRVLRGPGYDHQRAPWSVSTGKAVPGMESFDRMIAEFLREHRTPGAAIAVTDRGRTVLARGYGYADLSCGEKMSPTSLLRIASISKPITAVAILQYVEQGKLSLDDRITEVLDMDQLIRAAGDEFDPQWRLITIRHLLEHRGGWDRDKSFDAMFQSVRFAKKLDVDPPAGPSTIIQAMLSEKLDYAPGERYTYSNFGYCLLGRVIEKLSGKGYEQAVQENVLVPLGITAMRIGKTRLNERAPGEARYYQPGKARSVFQSDQGEQVPPAYGAWHLEAMDSHGGWLASAEDLAKFASAFDDPDNCPILSADSISLMYERPEGLAGHNEDGTKKDVYYSLGWLNRVTADDKINHWHTGSLDGTATILIRRHDGRNLIALLNTRASPSSTHLGRAIDQLLHRAADAVKEWP